MKFKCRETFIDRLSGPISMYCLDPMKKDLPFIILFGDDHTNSMYRASALSQHGDQCDTCKCDKDSKDCCMTFFDSEFLKLLNHSVQNSNSTIDINVESMDNQFESHSFNLSKFKNYQTAIENDLNTKLRYRFMGCFYTIIKKTNPRLYNEICQAPNLKWYHNDIRQIDSFNETETKRLESLIANCWSDNLFGLLFYFKIYSFTKENFDNLAIYNLIINCKGKDNVIMLCNLLEQFYSLNTINVFFELLFKNNTIESFMHDLIKKNDKVTNRDIIKIYLETILPLLYKRINNDKKNDFKVDDLNIFEYNNFKKNINHVFDSFASLFSLIRTYIIEPTDNNFSILKDKYMTLFMEIREDDVRYILNMKKEIKDAKMILDIANVIPFYSKLSLKDVHIIHSSFFLDFINLLRISRTKSKLAIFYVGEEHCQVFNQILIQYYKYQQRGRIDPEESRINRCINLKNIESRDNPGAFDIDIDKILNL